MTKFPGAAAVIGFVLLTFGACAQPAPPPSLRTVCTDPRPQMCTRIYQPVCATRRDGTVRTQGNPCDACGDAEVVSHRPGPC